MGNHQNLLRRGRRRDKNCQQFKHILKLRNIIALNAKSRDRSLAGRKGRENMKIAVTYENGEVFPHFGHTKQFKIYETADGKITGEQIADTAGSGHGALAGMLSAYKVDALICGGLGAGIT